MIIFIVYHKLCKTTLQLQLSLLTTRYDCRESPGRARAHAGKCRMHRSATDRGSHMGTSPPSTK